MNVQSEHWTYIVQMPLAGATPEDLYTGAGWYTVCVCLTPEHAGEVVRIVCAGAFPNLVRVESRRIIDT